MNQKSISNVAVLIAAAGLLSFLSSCAELESKNTKSLLSAAGFHTVTPTTALQKEVYAQMQPNHVQRISMKGKTIYAFKDEAAGIAYVGHEAEYQRYKDLCVQQRIAQDYYEYASMNSYYSTRWYGAWGYRGMYW
jgi:hypothetical protein